MNNGVLFGNILSLFEKKAWEKFGRFCLYSVNSTNLGYFVGKFLGCQYHKIETKNFCS